MYESLDWPRRGGVQSEPAAVMGLEGGVVCPVLYHQLQWAGQRAGQHVQDSGCCQCSAYLASIQQFLHYWTPPNTQAGHHL